MLNYIDKYTHAPLRLRSRVAMGNSSKFSCVARFSICVETAWVSTTTVPIYVPV